jgi:hypothetical protein
MEPEPEFDFETDCGNRPVCRSYGDGDSDVLERVKTDESSVCRGVFSR